MLDILKAAGRDTNLSPVTFTSYLFYFIILYKFGCKGTQKIAHI